MGTTAKGRNGQGEVTVTSKGSDPSDPSVCVRVSEGPGAGVMNGKETRSIYGWYSVTTLIRSESEQQKIREALGTILSGKRDQVTFETTQARPGAGRAWTATATWQRLGEAVLTIDGHLTTTIMLRNTDVGGAGSSYSGVWDLWYDPSKHMWLKGELRSPGGPVRDGFEVTSISSP